MNSRNTFKLIGLLFLLSILSGCQKTIPKEALSLQAATLENREAQSRYFDTDDEELILSATSAVLQDLGFTLNQSETKLGFLAAEKSRDATEAGQVAVAVVLAVLFGAEASWDDNQKIRIAVIVNRALDGKRTHVRAKFQRVVWNTKGQVSNYETLSEPELYQEFFEKLSKSAFLEAQKI